MSFFPPYDIQRLYYFQIWNQPRQYLFHRHRKLDFPCWMLEKLDFQRLFDQQTVWCLNSQFFLLVFHDLRKYIDLELFDPKLVGQEILQNCIENWLQDFCNHISQMVQMKLYRLIFSRSFLFIVMFTKSCQLTVLTTWYLYTMRGPL